jgi:hypothetical protein
MNSARYACAYQRGTGPQSRASLPLSKDVRVSQAAPARLSCARNRGPCPARGMPVAVCHIRTVCARPEARKGSKHLL